MFPLGGYHIGGKRNEYKMVSLRQELEINVKVN